MKFLVDQNVAVALADWLSENGHEAQHIKQIGLRQASDSDVAAEARRQGAVLITKDHDFLQTAARSLHDPLQVVLIRFGNTTNPELIERLGAALPLILSALD
ncbi:MAG: DUF5615 family PIN-like protein [Pseudomonadota bacterium]